MIEKDENAVESNEERKAKDSQEAASLPMLPKDVWNIILHKVSPIDRMKVARSSKFFNQVADSQDLWKMDCLYVGLELRADNPNYKETFKNARGINTKNFYYIVGRNIPASKSSNPWDQAFPYPIQRSKITKKEFEDSFPKEGQVMAFATEAEAITYARSRMLAGPFNKIESSPAIFKVKLSEGIMNINHTIVKPVSAFPPLPTPNKKPKEEGIKINYFTTNVANIHHVESAVMAYDRDIKITLDPKATKCAIM